MGSSAFDPQQYQQTTRNLNATGQAFSRSAAAQQTGNFAGSIHSSLDPSQLKNGMRESCFPPGVTDVLPIIISIDATGSMDKVPSYIQSALPDLMAMVIEHGATEHPNVLFMAHDDEHAVPQAAFQMSQFEAGADELVASLNELVFPLHGAGNRGEAYNLPIYAAAFHTRMDCYDKQGEKGFFFLIGDEEPYYYNADPTKHGTTPEAAKAIFNDSLEETVSMLDALKELSKRYHVFVIRPGHTQHGQNQSIRRAWQDLFRKAGLNPEHVLDIAETEAIMPTIALSIGSIQGCDTGNMVSVLKTRGATGVDSARNATMAIVPVGGRASVGVASGALATIDSDATGGRKRR